MNKHLATVAASLAYLSMPTAAIAQSGGKCMTPAEAQNLIAFAMPDIITGVTEQCKPHWPAKSFLVSPEGANLIMRYKTASTTAWPSAKSAMQKVMGDNPLMTAMNDDVLKTLLAAGISAGISGDIKPQDCATYDRVAAAIAPLPPENMATLIGVILESESKKSNASGKKSKLDICPAVAAK